MLKIFTEQPETVQLTKSVSKIELKFVYYLPLLKDLSQT
jgi:hypothetical protein